MDFFDAVDKRRSMRGYEAREVEQEKLDRILNAINKAPSAGNMQSYEVVVVKDKKIREALAQASRGQGFIADAPVVLVFCTNPLKAGSKYASRGVNLYSIQDATIAAAYSQLASTSLGLGTVWVGAFNPEQVAEAISAPEGITPVAIIPVGYTTENPSPTPRRSLDDLVKKEHF
ncbi:MAG: nitroreductase family protein [Armatimonadota bacterium]|jgi:nitroreductase